MNKKNKDDLRSARWFARDDLRSFNHRVRMDQMGYGAQDYVGKPLIGIISTWSDFSHCHAHFRDRIQDVKRGVLQAGGFPAELPALSLSESNVKPTTMLYRNFLAMETEELIRSHPVDGVVLMGGCDKTTPGLILGATSAGLPAIFVSAGPMLRGNWHGEPVAPGADAARSWDAFRAGNASRGDLDDMEIGVARSFGICGTMATAATMTSIAEAIGMTLPGSTSIPAADSSHARMCAQSGRRIVDMVWEDLVPSRIQSAAAYRNAIVVALALGCASNAVIHLLAMARRAGHSIGLEDFDAIARSVPLIANIRPNGTHYQMEDFCYAGGLLAVMSRLKDQLDLNQVNASGKTWAESLADVRVYNDDVIRPLDRAVQTREAIAVLRGNLAPDGCIMKPSATAPHLLKHSGPALVFESLNDLRARIDRDDLDVTPDHVLVLRNVGPLGGPGMPECGMLPIPKKLRERGVTDMIRISDARMSGASYGACVLHVSPEAYIGGPLALVRTDDIVSLDVAARSIRLEVPETELATRRSALPKKQPRYERGYGWLFSQHIRQAHEGCDFDFLTTDFGRAVSEPEIY